MNEPAWSIITVVVAILASIPGMFVLATLKLMRLHIAAYMFFACVFAVSILGSLAFANQHRGSWFSAIMPIVFVGALKPLYLFCSRYVLPSRPDRTKPNGVSGPAPGGESTS